MSLSSSATRRCVAGARLQLGEPSPATPGATVAGWNMMKTHVVVGWFLNVGCWMLGLGGNGCRLLLLLLLNSLLFVLWSFSLSSLSAASCRWLPLDCENCRRTKSGCSQNKLNLDTVCWVTSVEKLQNALTVGTAFNLGFLESDFRAVHSCVHFFPLGGLCWAYLRLYSFSGIVSNVQKQWPCSASILRLTS